MYRKWIVGLVVLAVLVAIPALAADGGKNWTAGKDAAKVDSNAGTDAPEGRLTILERRRLGLTIAKLLPAAKKAIAKGVDPKDEDALAAAILAQRVQDDPQAWKAQAVDWDAVLAFITKLLPLLLQLIALFG